jgi:hypothetical protein
MERNDQSSIFITEKDASIFRSGIAHAYMVFLDSKEKMKKSKLSTALFLK